MSTKAKVAEVIGQAQIIEDIQSIINRHSKETSNLHVLEAGCGSCSYFRFPGTAVVSGIDISREQLSRNRLLDERILGDIQTYSTDKKYDLIICWNVLEHLEQPENALSNLLTWTKKEGIIVIAVPNVFSAKGIVTKYTPYWFHRWAYKHILKFRNEPFPTFLKFTMSPKYMFHFFNAQSIEYKAFLGYSLRNPYGYVYSAFVNSLKMISFGRLHVDRSQFYIAVKKKKD